LFSKTKDLRTEQKQDKNHGYPDTINESDNEKKTDTIYWNNIWLSLKLLLLPLLPIFLLFKLLDYIHLLTFVIFGGLFLYFGITKISSNTWTDTALLILIGLVLVVAPILYVFDKQKKRDVK
jgi:hypothetical protein